MIRPRITDFFGVSASQESLDFAIPYFDEDLPFCVDPFLLWRSPSQLDTGLHSSLVDAVNFVCSLGQGRKIEEGVSLLIRASECREVGLGFSRTRRGVRISEKTAREILAVFQSIPQIRRNGFAHVEELQLYIGAIGKDRITDFACSFLKSFLIDYTISQCEKHGIPLSDTVIADVFDTRKRKFCDSEKVKLPINPDSGAPLMFVPKRWLRKSPWINSDDYIRGYFLEEVLKRNEVMPEKGEILLFNRKNFDIVSGYVEVKERSQNDCRNDPLFTQLPVISAKRKLNEAIGLPTGKGDKADKRYEELQVQLLSTLLYPHLDFADTQCRTDSGALIRDLIFYNNQSVDFLKQLFVEYESRQIVVEMKNVREVLPEHINQLHRYLGGDFGRFGIILTRSNVSRRVERNLIDLWSGKRVCIICLTDEDMALMVNVFESRQRSPIEVVNRKFIEFKRLCPS